MAVWSTQYTRPTANEHLLAEAEASINLLEVAPCAEKIEWVTSTQVLATFSLEHLIITLGDELAEFIYVGGFILVTLQQTQKAVSLQRYSSCK